MRILTLFNKRWSENTMLALVNSTRRVVLRKDADSYIERGEVYLPAVAMTSNMGGNRLRQLQYLKKRVAKVLTNLVSTVGPCDVMVMFDDERSIRGQIMVDMYVCAVTTRRDGVGVTRYLLNLQKYTPTADMVLDKLSRTQRAEFDVHALMEE